MITQSLREAPNKLTTHLLQRVWHQNLQIKLESVTIRKSLEKCSQQLAAIISSPMSEISSLMSENMIRY